MGQRKVINSNVGIGDGKTSDAKQMILAGLFIMPAFSQHPPLDKNWQVVFQDDFSTFDAELYLDNNPCEVKIIKKNRGNDKGRGNLQ